MSNIPKEPMMLLSFINTKLRDDYNSLDQLCEDLELNEDELIKTLSSIDYTYNPDLNRFL